MIRTAREFFDAVMHAARDAESCKTQLEALEQTAQFGSSNGMGERVGGNGGNAVERRTVAYVGQDARLEQRRKRDFELVDRACVLLYGPDQMGGGGLCAAEPTDSETWADILWWRYCAAAAWDTVAYAMKRSVRPCQEHHARALEWMDETGFGAEIICADEL